MDKDTRHTTPKVKQKTGAAHAENTKFAALRAQLGAAKAKPAPSLPKLKLEDLKARLRAAKYGRATNSSQSAITTFSPSTESNTSSLAAALDFLRQGLRPVPLRATGEKITRANGTSIVATGKEPIGTGWGRTVQTPESLRLSLEPNPGRGVGLVMGLGPDGADGFFDLEIDDYVDAQDTLRRIFRGQVPQTLGWSSFRGQHRLYKLTADYVAKLRALDIPSVVDGKTHRAYAGIELRFGTLDPADPKEVQSAAPPTSFPCRDGNVGTRMWEGESIASFPIELMLDLEATFKRSKRGPEPPPRPEDPDLSPIEMFEDQLVEMGLAVVRGDEGFTAQCPVHDDRTPSLSFREGDHGELLVYCHACGASFDEIMAAVGLDPSDGFLREESPTPRPKRRTNLAITADMIRHPFTEADFQKWANMAAKCETALILRPRERSRLAERLGVSLDALEIVRVGWKSQNRRKGPQNDEWVDDGPAWTFPEVDAQGRVIGIMRRFVDDALPKKTSKGARRGLIIPDGFADQSGPILVVEGSSDVAALVSVGKCAVGRPNNREDVALLADLLRDDPREVIIVGERDTKPDGTWPGDPAPVARALATRLGRPIKQMLPPPDYKDMRAYIVASKTGGNDAGE